MVWFAARSRLSSRIAREIILPRDGSSQLAVGGARDHTAFPIRPMKQAVVALQLTSCARGDVQLPSPYRAEGTLVAQGVDDARTTRRRWPARGDRRVRSLSAARRV